MRPTVLALSPHLDDAVFSAGATLYDLASRGWRVVVATIFTQSVANPQGFALACQLDKGLPAELDYMALRRDEDAAACAIVGAEALWLPFLEAPHRDYASASVLFAGLRSDDTIVAAIVPALRSLLDTLQPSVVLAPQAIGGHVDHEALVRGFDRIAWSGDIFWWRDYPYAMRSGAPRQPFRDRFDEMYDIELPTTREASDAKREASLAYHSQLGFQFGGADTLRARMKQTPQFENFRSTASAMPVG